MGKGGWRAEGGGDWDSITIESGAGIDLSGSGIPIPEINTDRSIAVVHP